MDVDFDAVYTEHGVETKACILSHIIMNAFWFSKLF